ncbi:MAG: LysR family transcriptional regulator [Elusimicrobia bacterium]|nr:LysR family transcriptional regulator [Elusimicrobiota bacterium]
MPIPAHELEAFHATAQTRSFSAAAKRVNITQPALSQRIRSLERALGLTLLVRDRKEARLTDAGTRLLRYCQAQGHLEAELLSDLGGTPEGDFGGRLRLAGYSTILHSVVVPALAGFLRENPLVQYEFAAAEMRDLPGMLESGEADFVVLDRILERSGLESVLLGREACVLIESSRFRSPDIYLDHDPNDRTTELFLKKQGLRASKSPARRYMDDIHGIINGAALGLGKAVVPRHLLSKASSVRVIPGLKPLEIPVVLHYFKQPYYSRLQKEIIQRLKSHCAERLGG